MDKHYEVRKLPLKTKIIFVFISILALAFFLIQENTKKNKAHKILINLGYHNISNLKVFKKTEVEDTISKIKGNKYFITFTNNQTKQECRGFILKDFKHNIDQDISCK